jgi:hypothetical protein
MTDRYHKDTVKELERRMFAECRSGLGEIR